MCGVPDHCHAGDHSGIYHAGMFSKVLAMVFEEAVRYKEENDLTI